MPWQDRPSRMAKRYASCFMSATNPDSEGTLTASYREPIGRHKVNALDEILAISNVDLEGTVHAILPGLPFGGVRSSGFGRRHGVAGIREFAVPKAVADSRALPGLTASMFGSCRPSAAELAAALRVVWGRGVG